MTPTFRTRYRGLTLDHIQSSETFMRMYICMQETREQVKGTPISNLPIQTKMAILSKRPILLALLLYEQFIHLTQITLCPNIQFLSTQERAYQSFLVTF